MHVYLMMTINSCNSADPDIDPNLAVCSSFNMFSTDEHNTQSFLHIWFEGNDIKKSWSVIVYRMFVFDMAHNN